jgi:hypothetical protein
MNERQWRDGGIQGDAKCRMIFTTRESGELITGCSLARVVDLQGSEWWAASADSRCPWYPQSLQRPLEVCARTVTGSSLRATV